MNVDASVVRRLLLEVRKVREELQAYVIAGDKIPVSADDLLDVVTRMHGMSIAAREVASSGNFLRGMLLRKRDRSAVILLRAGQTEGWARLTMAKELGQIILDEEGDFSTKPVETITGLLEMFSLELQGNSAYDPASSVLRGEWLSVIVAIELLYPAEFHAADALALSRKETRIEVLALRYKLPPTIIAMAHRNDYREAIGSVWAEIEAEGL